MSFLVIPAKAGIHFKARLQPQDFSSLLAQVMDPVSVPRTKVLGHGMTLDPTYSLLYKGCMQYLATYRFHGFDFLPVASNDNDDLLAISSPLDNLCYIRSLKQELREENAGDGLLLRSRRKRRFFQEIVDAEIYLTMRYFSKTPNRQVLQKLKRHILDHYLFPKTS